jgi:hypothetical protein
MSVKFCDTIKLVSESLDRGKASKGPAVAQLSVSDLSSILEDLERLDRWARESQFQDQVPPWMTACFGAEISADKVERNHRFYEEATELVQAGGMSREDAHALVDYTYGRPVGEKSQEVGGVMVTLAAWCLANGLNMHIEGAIELERIWKKVDQIRAKQDGKPKFGPLPGPAVTCQIYGNVVGCAECNVGDDDVIATNKVLADNYLRLSFSEPYAHEYGQSNGDGTYSVVIQKGKIPSYVTVYDGWPVKKLYYIEGAVKVPE